MRFHLLREEAAKIGGGGLGPRAFGEVRDGRVQDFFGDGAGFGESSQVLRRSSARRQSLAVEAGALAAEICALGVFGVFEPVPQPRQTWSSGSNPGKAHGPDTEVGRRRARPRRVRRSADVREPR